MTQPSATRRGSHALLALVAWGGLTGCMPRWLQNHGDAHDRVATADVDVMRLGEGSGGPYTAITPLRVRAPTVEKATTTAKSLCGSIGGEVVFLHSEPYQQRDLWTLVGSCSVSDQTISARATPALGS